MIHYNARSPRPAEKRLPAAFLTHVHAGGGYGFAMASIGAGAMLAGLLVGSINESRAINRRAKRRGESPLTDSNR